MLQKIIFSTENLHTFFISGLIVKAVLAYILINCVPGSEQDIISEIKKISEVTEVNGIMGRYDIFAKVSSRTVQGIDSTVHKIRDIKGITASYSMPVFYGQGGTIDEQE